MPLLPKRSVHESEEYFRAIFESSPDAITIVDLESGNYLDVNPSFTRFIGWRRDEVLGKRSDQINIWAKPDQRQRFWEAIKQQGRVEAMEADFRTKSDEVMTGIISGQITSLAGRPCLLTVSRDINELKKVQEERQRLEVQVSRTQRLESLGVLAGGIAHDFNNLLTAISGNVSLAIEMLSGSPQEVVVLLQEVERAGVRARNLTRQLLTFARGGDPVKCAVDLTPILEESARFALTGSANRLELDISPRLWTVNADAGQLSQVINNLVLNADQSMNAHGVIMIRAHNELVDKKNHSGLQPGAYTRVSVEDQGSGIAPEIIEHIFDPFFTTKKSGSGLGLSSVHSIVKAHGGVIIVKSTVGAGSEFTFWIPATPKIAPVSETTIQENVAHRKLRVLFLDDEPQIRLLVTKGLSNHGHEVTCAVRGEDAISLWSAARDSGQPFDIAILDLTIPGGLGGKETLERIHACDPHFKAIASSGYASDPVMAMYRDYGFAGCIAKPYGFAEFYSMIASITDQASSEGDSI